MPCSWTCASNAASCAARPLTAVFSTIRFTRPPNWRVVTAAASSVAVSAERSSDPSVVVTSGSADWTITAVAPLLDAGASPVASCTNSTQQIARNALIAPAGRASAGVDAPAALGGEDDGIDAGGVDRGQLRPAARGRQGRRKVA
jgi:hypothetical protein